jgi:hypothetical protein
MGWDRMTEWIKQDGWMEWIGWDEVKGERVGWMG